MGKLTEKRRDYRSIRRVVLGLFLLFTTPVFADINTDCANNQNCYNSGEYIYESGQDLVDLYNQAGTTNLNAGDDQWSSSVTLGNTWNRWGKSWNKARMSTNGCLNFVGRSDGANSSNCNDYTPQSLPYRNYTLYPFWTDLIRGQSNVSGCNNTWCSSKMLFKAFDDYVVFGWYYMREYNRSSSNSFEVILWNNDTYDYRYRELDIDRHDVLIGEQGANNELKTYLFYNDNQNGYNNFDQFLAGYGGPDIENGGSLYSEGLTFEQQCQADPLFNSQCSGYDAAYFTQQCNADALYDDQCPGYADAYFTQQCDLDALYDENCSGYAVAYFDLQCNLDPLYDEQCPGYWQELAFQESLEGDDDMTNDDGMYSDEELDMYGYDEDFEAMQQGYGSEEELYGYEDFSQGDMGDEFVEVFMLDEELFTNEMDGLYGEGWQEFTDEEWYEIDVEEFGQEQVDDWYGEDVEFNDDGMIEWDMPEEQYMPDDLVAQLDPTEIFELDQGGVVIFTEEEWIPNEEEEIFLRSEDIELTEEEFMDIIEDIETVEELQEFIGEIVIEETVEIEELVNDEALEELINEEELEELIEDEPELIEEPEEVIEETEEVVEEESSPSSSGPSRGSMVVAKLKKELGSVASSSVQVDDGSGSAQGGDSGSSQGSYSGSSSGNISSGGQSASSSTGSTFIQDQVEQTTGQVSIDVEVSDVVDAGPAVSAFEVAEQQQEDTSQQEMTFESGSDSFGGGDMDFSNSFNDALSTGQSIGQFLSNETPDFGKFDVAPPSVQESRTTKAVESLADRLGKENAQEQLQAQFEANQEAGGFEDQTIAVAVIGYNPDIQQYLGKDQLQDQENWYQVKALYTDAKIDDNKFNFYMMAGKTEKKLKEMIDSQYNKE